MARRPATQQRVGGWRAVVLATIVLAVATLTYFHLRQRAPAENSRADAAQLMADLMSGKTPVGGPFTLTDQGGHRRGLADYRGKLVLLYFGYTYCPDVCPTDLMEIGNVIRALGRDGDEVQPIFITLDPTRDSKDTLRAYVAAFHPRFVALTGSERDVRPVATSYKVFFEKVRPPGASTYLIDHSAYTFLLDREGRFVTLFPPGTPHDRMASMVREQLAAH